MKQWYALYVSQYAYHMEMLVIDTWTDTHTQIDTGNDNTWKPKQASDKKNCCNYQQ